MKNLNNERKKLYNSIYLCESSIVIRFLCGRNDNAALGRRVYELNFVITNFDDHSNMIDSFLSSVDEEN